MKLFILFFSIFFMMEGCKTKKDNIGPNDLPPETHIGANTFGCLINGKGFIPQGPPFNPDGTAFFYAGFSAQGFSIYATDQYHNPGPTFFLLIDSSNYKVGTFLLSQRKLKQVKGSTIDFTYDVLTSFTDSLSSPGQLIINFYDPQKHIVSGTFSFDAYDKKGVKYEIRSGRFDVK